MTRVFDDDLKAGFGTRAIHAGQRLTPALSAYRERERRAAESVTHPAAAAARRRRLARRAARPYVSAA